jgi:excisionase family DNA binding protein
MGKKILLNPDFISINSISSYCGVSTNTVRRWIDSGKLHALQLPSGHRRITVQGLIVFLKQNDIPVPKELSDSGSQSQEK